MHSTTCSMLILKLVGTIYEQDIDALMISQMDIIIAQLKLVRHCFAGFCDSEDQCALCRIPRFYSVLNHIETD